MLLSARRGGLLIAAITGAAAVGMLVYALLSLAFPPRSALLLTVSLSGPQDVAEASYRSSFSEAYHRDNFRSEALTADTPSLLRFRIPPTGVRILRIDPLSKPGTARIHKITLSRLEPPARKLEWDAAGIARDFIARDHITSFALRGDAIEVVNIGTDPFFETRPELGDLIETLAADRSSRIGFLAVAATCGAILLAFVATRLRSARLAPFLRLGALAAFSCAFLAATAGVRAVAPPLQGADEIDHAARLVAFELSRPCGDTPVSLLAAWESVSYLPHHPEARYSGNFGSVSGDTGFVVRENGTCRYLPLYLALPSLLDTVMGNAYFAGSPAEYLARARAAVSISALLTFLLPLIVVMFGRPLWPGEAVAARLAGILTCGYMVFLPQTIWASGIINQEYFLLAAGLLAAAGVFFRVPLVSDVLNAGLLAAGASKTVYTMPFLFLVALHYLLVLERRTGVSPYLRLKHLLLTAAALCAGLALAWFVAKNVCATRYCYGLEQSGLLHSATRFADELREMAARNVLSMPSLFHADSAFGKFGWVDAPMHRDYAMVYSAPVMWALAVALAASIPLAIRRDIPLRAAALGVVLAEYWVLCVIAVYLIFQVMVIWCGPGAAFGCAYQRRYELPLYPLVVYAIFYFALSAPARLARSAETRQSVTVALFAVLLMAQAFAGATAYRGMIETIEERYRGAHD